MLGLAWNGGAGRADGAPNVEISAWTSSLQLAHDHIDYGDHTGRLVPRQYRPSAVGLQLITAREQPVL